MLPLHDELLHEFQDFAGTASSVKSIMEHVSARMHEKNSALQLGGILLG